jgi:hypothetical protein
VGLSAEREVVLDAGGLMVRALALLRAGGAAAAVASFGAATFGFASFGVESSVVTDVAGPSLLVAAVPAREVARELTARDVAAPEVAALAVAAPEVVAAFLPFPAFGAALTAVFGAADLAARAAVGAAVVTVASTGFFGSTSPSCARASVLPVAAPRDARVVALATPVRAVGAASGAASTTVPGRRGDDRTRDQVRSPRSARLP